MLFAFVIPETTNIGDLLSDKSLSLCLTRNYF